MPQTSGDIIFTHLQIHILKMLRTRNKICNINDLYQRVSFVCNGLDLNLLKVWWKLIFLSNGDKRKIAKGQKCFSHSLDWGLEQRNFKKWRENRGRKNLKKNKIFLAKRRKLFHRISLPISGFKHILLHILWRFFSAYFWHP